MSDRPSAPRTPHAVFRSPAAPSEARVSAGVGLQIPLAAYAALLRSRGSGKPSTLRRRVLEGEAISAPPYDGLEQDLAALASRTILSGVIAEALHSLPSMLSAIPDPPLALFCDGDVTALERPCVAVIGARRASRFGIAFAEQLGRDLAQAGLTVVSGLAYGIDAAAHRGALAADAHSSAGGTIAVLGSGLEHIYPASNRGLAGQIRSRGCLVSEYLPYTPPAKHRFPERNRLVSGLASAVVVVEAGERSGSLITARLALEQGRDVFAVPGPPGNELSAGCHRLIRQGAALVTSAEQVLAELPSWAQPQSRPRAASPDVGLPSQTSHLSQAEQALLLALSSVPQPLEQLAEQFELTPQDLVGLLAGLELAGFVDATVHGYIRRPLR